MASDLSVGGGLFTEIRSCLQDSFNCLNVCKIPRSCNSCAHDLASLSMSWDPGQFCLWTDPLPEFVTRWAARDLAKPESVNIRP
jgi:hypothetical protein